MGTVNVVLGEDTRLNLILGQQLENAVTSVVFDFSAWQTTYGSGTLALSVQRPGDEMPYAVTMTTSGTNATWSVTNLDTAYKGVGHIQLTYTVGTAIKKSVVYKFTVYESLGANGEYPSPGQTWQQNIEAEIGTLSNLPTTDKSSLVASISEIDGDITDVKQDLSDNKKSLNAIIADDADIPIYTVGETDIVVGGFSSGVETSTSNRARNTRFIHVYPGDVVVVSPVENGAYRTYAILTYGLNFSFVAQGSWTGLGQTTFKDFTSECYIRVIFNVGNTSHTSDEYKSYFKNCFTVIRSAGNKNANVAVLDRYGANPFERIIETSDIRKGTLDTSGNLQPHDGRCVTPSFIPVMEGDYLERINYSVGISLHYYDSNFNHVSGSTSFEYNNYPSVVPSGVSYVRIAFNNPNISYPTPTDFDGVIKIIHFAGRTEMLSLGLLNRVERSTSNDFVRGYVNPSTGAIQSHDHYAATQKMFKVNQGDIVRITKNNMFMGIREFDSNRTVIRVSPYIGKENKNPYSAGEWRVSTNGYIRATIINYDSSTDVDFVNNGDMLEIVHVASSLSEQDALGDSWVTPRNYIRPRIIRENQDLYSQSGVIIDGFLYQATDDYNGHYTMQKVDIESGTTVKTYTHNIGHCASLDYCPETDTLVTWDDKIILYPNFKTALQGSTLSLSDCIVINTDLPTDSSWCFGEDGYTLYGFQGYDATLDKIVNNAYKVELGYGTNDLSSGGYGTYSANDSYNGTAKLLSTFNGEIREYHDGIFKTNGLPYSQDIKYDGYLYLGYGTKGYNCFVLDLDENSLTYKVKGNYTWIYRTSAYADKYGEPQVVALNGSKIVSVLRDLPTNISCMIEFNRS